MKIAESKLCLLIISLVVSLATLANDIESGNKRLAPGDKDEGNPDNDYAAVRVIKPLHYFNEELSERFVREVGFIPFSYEKCRAVCQTSYENCLPKEPYDPEDKQVLECSIQQHQCWYECDAEFPFCEPNPDHDNSCGGRGLAKTSSGNEEGRNER